MSRRKLAAKVGVVGLCMMLALGGLQASAAESDYHELANFPGQGIPEPGGPGAWVTPQQQGLTYLETAKQWARTPVLQSVAFNRGTQELEDPTCRRISQAPGARRFREWAGDVTLVDRGAALDSPRRYGYTQSFEVRTVAFGSVPVEATVALEQPRSAAGVVSPFELRQGVAQYCAGQGGFEIPASGNGRRSMPANGKGRLRVRVDQLVVDGVVLRMAGKCMADGASLALTSRDYLEWDPRIPDEDRLKDADGNSQFLHTKYFELASGGLLFGSLNIPAFKGCTTANDDDLSALLTATVSGDANTVQIRTEALGGTYTGEEGIFGSCPFGRGCEDRFPASELPTEPPS